MLSRLTASLLLLALAVPSLSAQENWPRFRGENGTGVSGQTGLPVTWSPGDFEWNIALPGVGHGSPIVWGDRLYITSGSDDGSLEGGSERYLYCIDAATGEAIWSRTIGFNSTHRHKKNSFASSTPCTDGRQVYVAFADEPHLTLAAYTMDGELQWRRLLGPFTSQHGLGISPILFDGMVILAKDMMGPSEIMALDTETGQTVWSTLRHVRRTSYATPILIHTPDGATQLIAVSGASGVSGLDPYTGRPIWWTKEFPMRTVAAPVYANGLIIASCGGGGRGSDLWAVDPTGTGDVSDTHIKWELHREIPYVPTPIVNGDYLYLLTDLGVLNCVEIATGKSVWAKRVTTTTVSSSPVMIDGKIYCPDEKGIVTVVDASPEFKSYGQSPLGDPTHATPAVAGGRLYFRTFHRLVALRASPESASGQ